MKTVYLAGPITGLNYEGATSWRDEAVEMLAEAGIKGLSPMRCKEYLQDIEEFSAVCDYGHMSALSGGRGVMTRDYFDATRCDILLVNFTGVDKPSLGTVMEIAWAYHARTPVVAIMEDGNVHDHAMINEAIGFRVESLDEAVHIVKAILL